MAQNNSDRKWKLIHSVHRYEIGGLSTAEAVGFLARFPESERSAWWAWKPGMKDWIPSHQSAELRVTPGTQPWLFDRAFLTDQDSEKIAPEIRERRKFPRIQLRLRVVAVNEGRTFRSHSKNVSLGGLLLETKIPWSLPGKICRVFLMNQENSEYIEFDAKIISDSADPFRIAFESPDQKFQVILAEWIERAQNKRKIGEAA